MSDSLAGQGLELLPQYLTALAIGLLIGLERERNPAGESGLAHLRAGIVRVAGGADLFRRCAVRSPPRWPAPDSVSRSSLRNQQAR
jgi:hypothetical protein